MSATNISPLSRRQAALSRPPDFAILATARGRFVAALAAGRKPPAQAADHRSGPWRIAASVGGRAAR